MPCPSVERVRLNTAVVVPPSSGRVPAKLTWSPATVPKPRIRTAQTDERYLSRQLTDRHARRSTAQCPAGAVGLRHCDQELPVTGDIEGRRQGRLKSQLRQPRVAAGHQRQGRRRPPHADGVARLREQDHHVSDPGGRGHVQRPLARGVDHRLRQHRPGRRLRDQQEIQRALGAVHQEIGRRAGEAMRGGGCLRGRRLSAACADRKRRQDQQHERDRSHAITRPLAERPRTGLHASGPLHRAPCIGPHASGRGPHVPGPARY